MRRVLVSFATPEYLEPRTRLIESARPYFSEFLSFGPKDLPHQFVLTRNRHFAHRRGFGYWVWKPWAIQTAMEALPLGTQIFYADAQCVFESDPAALFALADQGVGIFHQKREGHKNSTWTKRETFRRMGCDAPEFWDGDNLVATFSAWVNTSTAQTFVDTWLTSCSDYQTISDFDPRTDGENFPNFRDHRHDQSILSLLAIAHGIRPLCDCSQFGDGYRCPTCTYPRILRVDRIIKQAPWYRCPDLTIKEVIQ